MLGSFAQNRPRPRAAESGRLSEQRSDQGSGELGLRNEAERGAARDERAEVGAVQARGDLTAELDDGIHVDQVSVSPAHRGERIGAALIDHVAGLARASGRSAVTLTTFRDIPWNAPYYARLGFRDLPEQEWGPQLHAQVAHERAVIPVSAPRVAMTRPL